MKFKALLIAILITSPSYFAFAQVRYDEAFKEQLTLTEQEPILTRQVHSNDLTTYKRDIAPLSKRQTLNALKQLGAILDSWTEPTFIAKLFKKTPMGRDFYTNNDPLYFLSLILSYKSNGLLEAFSYAANSRTPAIFKHIVSIPGERTILTDMNLGNLDRLKSALFFLRRMEEGDNIYERQKFRQLLEHFRRVAESLAEAAQTAEKTGTPVLLEIQSSAVSKRTSPIISRIAYLILEELSYDNVRTPDSGFLVKMDPKATQIVANIFSEIFQTLLPKVRDLRDFTDLSSKEFIESRNKLSSIFSGRSPITKALERAQMQSYVKSFKKVRELNPLQCHELFL